MKGLMMKKWSWFIAVASLWVGCSSGLNAQTLSYSPSGKVKVSGPDGDLLISDSMTLMDEKWKSIDNPMSGKPQIAKEGNRVIYRWQTAASKMTRTSETMADGGIMLKWEYEIKPGLAGGRYVELTLVAPFGSYGDLPVDGQRLLKHSADSMEFAAKSGKVIFDFNGTEGEWLFEDLRKVGWLKNLRFRFAQDYSPAEGLKKTAVIIIKPIKG